MARVLDIEHLIPRKEQSRILLIGPLPPPFGGVSVYMKRYRDLLESRGHQVDCFDPSPLEWREKLAALADIWKKGYDLIQINIWSPTWIALFVLTGLGRRTQFYDHGWREMENWGSLRRKVYSFFLSRLGSVLLVGEHLEAGYDECEVELPKQTYVMRSFIPPRLDEEDEIVNKYPTDLIEFIARHGPIIIVSAFRIVFHNGVDLYGLDMTVELLARLRKKLPGAGLIIALAEVGDESYLERLMERINELGLATHAYVFPGQKEVWPLFRRCQLMVRPTVTDGFGISIAEALFCKCPAVASDVCSRPEGTILFASRNLDDFERKCRQALNV